VKPVFLLMGPTAAGKTDLALDLVADLPLEIVSVDSAMIYKGLNIGSGKPSREILDRVKHHLVDVLDPGERYSAGQFVRDAERLIGEIRQRGKVPLLVGGTMLYFKALINGIADLPEADSLVRASINEAAAKNGWPAMHEELRKIDPAAAAKILPNDAQRIQRALEVFQLTGRRLSELQVDNVSQSPNEAFVPLVWSPTDRKLLHERIAARFVRMMEEGFLEEVQRLFARKDLSRDLPAMRAVGYRQLLAFLHGEISRDEAVEQGIAATRQLARRQLIWLRAGKNYQWFDCLELSAAGRIKECVVKCLHAE
jgi:tRNA dimethylallyltransferase